jgi:peptidyl-prolyl cis-trans isomerase D
MALIGKIRNNMWFVIILLALGLGGFVFMDISSVGGMGGGGQFSIGAVNGSDIDWVKFQNTQEALYPNSSGDVYSERDYIWSYFVEDAIIRGEAEDIGLNVGDDELEELQFGTRLSPVVQRNFMDPQTGQVNREQLNSFRQGSEQGTLAPQYQRIWDFQQEEIVKDRLEAKLVMLVKKAIYTPTWMVEDQQKAQSARVDFKYVFVPFDQVSDAEIKVSDADYAAYVKEHRKEFERQFDARDARYVVFDVFPTPEDSTALLETFNETIAQFKIAENDSMFVVNHGGSYDARYFKAEGISESLVDTIFDLPVDSVYGPYIEEGAYKAVKVLGRQLVPDSVRSRHILIKVETQEQVAPALALADSIENVLKENFSKFDTLARRYSQDPGSGAKGGDLGFIGLDGFVKPMNDLLFYEQTEKGKAYRAISQFGIHIVEVTDKKFESNTMGVKLAYLSEAIVPGEATQDGLYDDALEFAGQHRSIDALKSTVEKRGDLVLESANNIPKSGYQFGTVPAGNTARDIVRWLYNPETELGDVAPTVFVIEDDVNYFNAQYIIVGLDAIHEKGLAKPESIREMIEAPVKNKKRSEVLLGKIKSQDLEEVAQQFGVTVDTVEGVNIGIQQMRTIGEEPTVLGTALGMSVGQTSKPIVGRNGVYLIHVIDKIEGTAPQNITQMRRQATFQYANSADLELLDAMRKNARIEDNRYTFF